MKAFFPHVNCCSYGIRTKINGANKGIEELDQKLKAFHRTSDYILDLAEKAMLGGMISESHFRKEVRT